MHSEAVEAWSRSRGWRHRRQSAGVNDRWGDGRSAGRAQASIRGQADGGRPGQRPDAMVDGAVESAEEAGAAGCRRRDAGFQVAALFSPPLLSLLLSLST